MSVCVLLQSELFLDLISFVGVALERKFRTNVNNTGDKLLRAIIVMMHNKMRMTNSIFFNVYVREIVNRKVINTKYKYEKFV